MFSLGSTWELKNIHRRIISWTLAVGILEKVRGGKSSQMSKMLVLFILTEKQNQNLAYPHPSFTTLCSDQQCIRDSEKFGFLGAGSNKLEAFVHN